MSRTNSNLIATISVIAMVVLVILTWPRLSLQTKFEGGQSSFIISNLGTAKLTVGVWNTGGAISDWSIITPNNCVSAKIPNNITCMHEGFSGTEPCTKKVCGPSKVQELGPIDNMEFKFNRPYPNNFTFNLDSQSSFGPLVLKNLNESYFCNLNENLFSTSFYNCSTI